MKRTRIVPGVAVAAALTALLVACEHGSNRETEPISDSGTTYSLVSETFATHLPNRSRTKLGVGESVTLRVVPEPKEAPHWTRQGPGELDRTVGDSVIFTAAGWASSPIISTVVHGERLAISFQVVEPQLESVHTGMGCPLKHHLAGVQMRLEIEVLPTDVSFGNVEVREISGEPSRVTGYFTRLSPKERYHTAEGWRRLTEINDRNQINSIADYAGIENLQPPYSEGAIEWNIPGEWRVISSSHVGKLPDAVQYINMNGPAGSVTVTKLKASVTRDLFNPKTTVEGAKPCRR